MALTEFPFTTQISDANEMVKGLKLSDQSEFIVKVRISKTGDVMNKDGDWQGVSGIIKAGQTTPVNIVINEKL
ncbi:hypothetical protein ACLKMH_06575 [Psychromonas sp. KJ10-10]|uniref:c-type cytochrome biogenesis protein CcmI/CycH n=1 Tax=Psychromonas sp. KJ10-10 TaxID=3391823 RepID=UPI0039B62F37